MQNQKEKMDALISRLTAEITSLDYSNEWEELCSLFCDINGINPDNPAIIDILGGDKLYDALDGMLRTRLPACEYNHVRHAVQAHRVLHENWVAQEA